MSRQVERLTPSIPAPINTSDSMFQTMVAVKNSIDMLLGHSAKVNPDGFTDYQYTTHKQYVELLKLINELDVRITELGG